MTEVRELAVPGVFVFVPTVFADDRGAFVETYSQALFARTVGHALVVGQVNTSVSRRSTMRGLHYSVAPSGQAKYVTCTAGAVLDVAVDLRVGSPSFGAVDSVVLDSETRSSVYLPEGMGHAFLALSDEATVTYLCSTPYSPEHELSISPLDPSLALPWPEGLAPYVLSPRDAAAPSLEDAVAAGRLPAWTP